MGPDVCLAPLAPDHIVSALPRAVWFSSVGEPLRDAEVGACLAYLAGVRLPNARVQPVRDWQEAAQLAIPSARWASSQVEEREARHLFASATGLQSTHCVLMRLANLMHGSAPLLHAAATRACCAAGFCDPELTSQAAGAAAQTLHQFGLAAISRRPHEHLFAAKFRLFLAGRWPLRLDHDTFYIF